MSRAKSLLALLFVGIVIALVFLPRERNPGDDATIAESISVSGYTSDGSLLWDLRAQDGRLDGPDQTLHEVTLDFYGEDSSAMSIRGDRLERAEASSRLSGNIRIEREDDLLLEVESLTWNEVDEKLSSGPIALTSEDLCVSAAQFVYDLETETASFSGDVEAIAKLETDWAIQADRAEEQGGVVVFRGAIRAASEDSESFRCTSLKIETETKVAYLSGDVVGEWPSGQLSAESVRWNEDGVHAIGRVEARLDLEELRKSNDP